MNIALYLFYLFNFVYSFKILYYNNKNRPNEIHIDFLEYFQVEIIDIINAERLALGLENLEVVRSKIVGNTSQTIKEASDMKIKYIFGVPDIPMPDLNKLLSNTDILFISSDSMHNHDCMSNIISFSSHCHSVISSNVYI